MSQETRKEVSRLFKQCQEELLLASRHFEIASAHFEEGRVPAGCAHAFAAQGHLKRVSEWSASASEIHANHALLPPSPSSETDE